MRAISPVRLPGAVGRSRPPRAARELFVRALWCGACDSGAFRIQARCLFLSLIRAPALRPGRFSPGGGAGPGCARQGAQQLPATSGPCASRVTSGGDDGARADMPRSAARMSSGRTAGVMCRTTIRSIAHPASLLRRGTPVQLHGQHGGASVEPPDSLAGQAIDLRGSGGQERLDCPGRRPLARHRAGRPAIARPPVAAPPAPRPGPVTSITSIPSGSAASSRTRTSSGIHAAGECDLQVLSLAGRACRRPAGVRNLGMRREASGISDWQPSLPHSPLHRTRDIPVARKTHPCCA